MEVKELHEKLNQAWSEMKTFVDRQAEEIKKHGEASGETKASLQKANEDLARIEGQMKALEQEVKEIKRPALGGRDGNDNPDWRNAPAEEKSRITHHPTWLKLARVGLKGLEPEERKALFISDDTTGGYLARPEYVREIIKDIVEFSPIRQFARIRTTGSKSVQIPKRTGTFAAQRIHERATRVETPGLTWGLNEIPVHEMYADIRISLANLEDSEFNLEQEIRMEAAEQFGVRDGRDFLVGSGVGEPEGILTNTSVGQTASGNATSIASGDALYALQRDVKQGYIGNSRYVWNRKTLFHVRTLKDGESRYLFDPGTPGATPATIAGHPWVEAVDMPDIAPGSTPIVFGDLRRGYTIVDRVGMAMQRLDEKYAELGQVGFLFRMRDGGQVVQAEALRKLVISAS